MVKRIAEQIIRFRIPILIIIVGVTIFLASQFRGIKIVTDLDDFVPQGHPYARVQKMMEDEFHGGDMVQMVVETKEGDIFTIDFLSRMLDITQDVYLLPGILPPRLASLSDYKTKVAKGYPGGFDVYRLIEGGKPRTEEKVRKIKEGVLGDKLIYGRLASLDLKATNIMAEFRDVDYTELFHKFQDIAKKWIDDKTYIYLSGRPIMLGWIDYYQRELTPIFILAIVIIAILLYLAFKGIRGVILPLLAAMISVIWGLGLLGILGFNLDPMASIIPFLILGIGVSHSVQIIKRYYEESSRIDNPKEVCIKVITVLAAPALTSIITDAFAFATIITVKIRMLQSLAIIGSLSLLSITFNVLVFIPCCLSFLPLPKKANFESSKPNKILTKIAILSTNRKGAWGLLVGFTILVVIGIIGTSMIQVGGRAPGAGAFYSDADYAVQTRAIGQNFPGAITFYLVFEGKERNAIKDVRILQKIEALQEHLKKNPKVGGSVSLCDFMKRMNVVINEGDESFYHIPYVGDPPHGLPNSKLARKRIAEYLNLYTAGVPEEFSFIIDYDYRLTNLQVFLKDMKANTIRAVLKDTKEFIARNWKRGDVSILMGKGDGTFEKRVNYQAGDWPRSVIASDFNGDNGQDLAVVNGWSDNISIFLGKGDGTFQSAVHNEVGESPNFICSSDFNGDGKQDLAVSNWESGDISILLGKGDGTFEPTINYSIGEKPRFIVSSDFNGDGRSDIAVINQGSNTLSILLGKGDGTFRKVKDYDTEEEPRFVTSADFNGDDKIDLAVSHWVNYSIAFYLGNGDGSFEKAKNYWVNTNVNFLTSSDFNEDKQMDLAFSRWGTNSITIMLGKGNGNFEQPMVYQVGMEPHFLVSKDFNQDGWQDLAVVNNFSNDVSLLLSRGDGTFQSAVHNEVGESPNFICTSDFNGDGNPDIAVVNEDGGAVKVCVAGGLAGVVGAINEELQSGMVSNITQISLIVFLCCALMLRSFVGAFIVLLSLFTRVIVTYGVMGFIPIPLTMYTTPIASMGIGIGVDYVIYVLVRIKEELAQTKDNNIQEATILALNTTGRAVFYTVMAVVLGVLVFILSPLKFQMELGSMIALIIFLNGLGAIALMAPIVYIIKPKFIFKKNVA